ncbi:hypothetical protein GCM10010862_00730 [Devosia nitrariae]|uniref:Uncharacterized protein n=1 Tax=Devosia nitrariae TaxID=2071872 RepID=A0ABQ5VYV3_9HYPH|nr:hypothetical protein GCM10010862_00730 [Devosia nitrariae]
MDGPAEEEFDKGGLALVHTHEDEIYVLAGFLPGGRLVEIDPPAFDTELCGGGCGRIESAAGDDNAMGAAGQIAGSEPADGAIATDNEDGAHARLTHSRRRV